MRSCCALGRVVRILAHISSLLKSSKGMHLCNTVRPFGDFFDGAQTTNLPNSFFCSCDQGPHEMASVISHCDATSKDKLASRNFHELKRLARVSCSSIPTATCAATRSLNDCSSEIKALTSSI